MTEFNLSEKSIKNVTGWKYRESDVKEFIMILKEDIRLRLKYQQYQKKIFYEIIDKLAGGKLV